MVENQRGHAARRLGAIPCRLRCSRTRRCSRVRRLALQPAVRLRLVSACRDRLASVLLRPLAVVPALRLDVGRHRSLRLADASLRPLGLLVRRLVLDSGIALGAGLGVVGVRAGLRELVPAGLRQPRGVRAQRQYRSSVLLVHYSPWNYWTVVAAPHFGYGYVHQRVVHVDRVFAAQSRPVFVSRPSAPASRGVAVRERSRPRSRWAGARGSAVTRGARAGTRSTVGPDWPRQQLFPARQQSRGPRGPA